MAGVYFSSFFLFSMIVYLLVEVDTKSRLMYNYPLGVLAACGLMWLQGKRSGYPRRIIPVFFALVLVAYQLRSLANLV